MENIEHTKNKRLKISTKNKFHDLFFSKTIIIIIYQKL